MKDPLLAGGQGQGQGVELCFYKYVSVDNLLLGRWFDWGPFPDLDPATNSSGSAGASTSTYQIDKDGMVTETAPTMPAQTTLGWLGGLASAMSGVKVDQYQQHLLQI